MMRRIADPEKLQALILESENQEVKRGNSRSVDPKFPVFYTPVGTNILVYFPRTNLVATENGEEMKVLEAYIHEYRKGSGYGAIRCINGLAGNPLFDELGYDGECPACQAVQECWELYKRKLEKEAKRMGVTDINDESLKPVKQRLITEMDVRPSELFVTFPIVQIPTVGRMQVAPDAVENLKPMFVTWKKKRYQDNIINALDSVFNNPGHPAGMFWQWNFVYDTGGKQPNARDAARNAKYMPITDPQALESLKKLVDACEEVAKEFTIVKAAEVLVANMFMHKDEIKQEMDKVMQRTRQFLNVWNEIEEQKSLGSSAYVNPLEGFTTPQPALPDNQGVGGQAPINLGVNNPIKFQ